MTDRTSYQIELAGWVTLDLVVWLTLGYALWAVLA